MNRLFLICLAALAMAGCKAMPFSPLLSPRVTGRVVAADTGEPLADVQVTSGRPAGDFNSRCRPKAANS